MARNLTHTVRGWVSLLPWLVLFSWIAGCIAVVDAKPTSRSKPKKQSTGRMVSWIEPSTSKEPPATRVGASGTSASPGPAPRSAVPLPTVPSLPSSRHLASLAPETCLAELANAPAAFTRADVTLEGAALVKLEGPLDGIDVRFAGRSPVHALLDCRLALALHRWAPVLKALGVRRIDHLSAYRPAARVRTTGKPSGHATGLAIDVATLVLEGGETLEVQRDWTDRTRNAPPCPARPEEQGPARSLREVVCAAADAGVFQVVITPHHDEAHADHVHLELVPDVDWTYVR